MALRSPRGGRGCFSVMSVLLAPMAACFTGAYKIGVRNARSGLPPIAVWVYTPPLKLGKKGRKLRQAAVLGKEPHMADQLLAPVALATPVTGDSATRQRSRLARTARRQRS